MWDQREHITPMQCDGSQRRRRPETDRYILAALRHVENTMGLAELENTKQVLEYALGCTILLMVVAVHRLRP